MTAATAHDSELSVTLDVPLPAAVTVGAGTAIFVCGWCFHPYSAIRELRFVLDGVAQPVMAMRMPRLDPLRELHPRLDMARGAAALGDPSSPEDPELRSYRSGFWGLVRIDPLQDAERELRLTLEAQLHTGGAVHREIGRIAAFAQARRPVDIGAARTGAVSTGAAGTGEPLVAICMATFNPPADLFEAQIRSIRAQSHRNWVCLISDDCSSPDHVAAVQREVGDDPRFVVSRSARRLGFFHNFERALSLAPPQATFVALADQDDAWYPDKLAALIAGIGHAPLIYSDARVVDRDGRVQADTYWSRRRNNHTDLVSLLVANSVTGAASLFRRELLDDALPFPPGQFAHYHDHWIALVASVGGEIRFIDRPLYDYVQHGEAALGHATANQMVPLRQRVATLRSRGLGERARKWRMHYFVDVARLMALATILELRCGERIVPAKRTVLRRTLRAEHSLPTLIVLMLRGLRELTTTPETLGAEWLLFGALLWRRLLPLTAREFPQRHLRLDALPPTDLAPAPNHAAGRTARVEGIGGAAGALAAKIEPLPFRISEAAPRRINLLIPTIDLDHLFAGYIAKFNLAKRLAARGARVRIVTVDPTPRVPHGWQQRLERYAGLAGLCDGVEFAFGREADELPVSAQDAFIATTWWTAHIAHAAAPEQPFLYLIQEYEPFTFPMGSHAALAAASYDLPHQALFSTQLLRDYFRRHAIGVYRTGQPDGDAASVCFENAITSISVPAVDELAARTTRRLLFYARPEPHAARNMFELGIVALARAVQRGVFAEGWELAGIGSVRDTPRVSLGPDTWLEVAPRSAQQSYAELLRRHDVGLALMYTPHPSMVPLEMASAGMLTVTNTFEHKTADALSEISGNLIAAVPTVDGIADALADAVAQVGDHERRVHGAQLRWSSDWDRSFDARVLAQVERFLGS